MDVDVLEVKWFVHGNDHSRFNADNKSGFVHFTPIPNYSIYIRIYRYTYYWMIYQDWLFIFQWTISTTDSPIDRWYWWESRASLVDQAVSWPLGVIVWSANGNSFLRRGKHVLQHGRREDIYFWRQHSNNSTNSLVCTNYFGFYSNQFCLSQAVRSVTAWDLYIVPQRAQRQRRLPHRYNDLCGWNLWQQLPDILRLVFTCHLWNGVSLPQRIILNSPCGSILSQLNKTFSRIYSYRDPYV